MTGPSDTKRGFIVAAALVVPAAVLFTVAWYQAGKIQAKATSGTMKVWNERD